MPIIYDNIEKKFGEGLHKHLKTAKRVDYCAGYFNIRGWKTVCQEIDDLEGMSVVEEGNRIHRYCRLLIGMTKTPMETIIDGINPDGNIMDNEKAAKTKRLLAEELKKQLELGSPTNDDERTIRHLLKQLKGGRVVVKLFLEYQLHAKLYLAYTEDSLTEKVALLGSSNFTFSGLQGQGELNVDVLEQDAAKKLSRWFDQRWNSRWCIDITKELIEVLENSWAREETLSPYCLYMKMAYHLSQEARSGISEFKLPREFQKELLDFQQKAVLIAAQHLNKRNGVMVGDVVGLGKTITACAIAKIMEDDLMMNTLILCPKNLVEMWEEYVERYGLHAKVLSHSMILSELPSLKRYRLLIIDESHNFRNSENKTYKVVKSYIEENDSKVILLSATPYNKSYGDLANQLKLFIPEDLDLGVGPERYIDYVGGAVAFHMKHDNLPVRSIGAFEQSVNTDDWRELMRLYLVRRTRSFIKNNYALTDVTSQRKYLEFYDGTKSFFPERIPKKVTFSMSKDDENDQYARLYAEDIVELIDSMALPRYTMIDYVKENPSITITLSEQQMIENLSRAGHKTKGFCRTNLFKRPESSGYSFMLSVSRLILRNYLVEYAANNNLMIPIGGNSASVEMDSNLLMDFDLYGDYEENSDILTPKNIGCNEEDYRRRAKVLYDDIYKNQRKRFQWIRAELFDCKRLEDDLLTDNRKLLKIVETVPVWKADEDRKLEALYELLSKKHCSDKVLIFTQYSDTALYLKDQLIKMGIDRIGLATGDTKDVTTLVKRFSPKSNNYELKDNEELRVIISTDVLSEGQNLQDAHVIVNFDLPWALIRLVQRAGRVDRLGQKSNEILCYSFLPEEGIEQIIKLRDKLKTRIKQNAEVVGSDEVFFDGDPINIADLYSEKSGVLDDENDGEVDLASYAYQIWKNATDKHPELKKTIPALPNVVYSTKANTSTYDEDSVIVYSKTSQGNDVFSWIDKNGNVITQSQYRILQSAECEYGCQAQPKIPNHHEIVAEAVQKASEEEYSGMGTLGRRTGIRYKAYMKLNRFIEEIDDKDLDSYKKALDDIYKFPLCEYARDVLGRLLKTSASDYDFAEAVITLREDNRLCITEENQGEYKPVQIICSLGMRKAD